MDDKNILELHVEQQDTDGTAKRAAEYHKRLIHQTSIVSEKESDRTRLNAPGVTYSKTTWHVPSTRNSAAPTPAPNFRTCVFGYSLYSPAVKTGAISQVLSLFLARKSRSSSPSANILYDILPLLFLTSYIPHGLFIT